MHRCHFIPSCNIVMALGSSLSTIMCNGSRGQAIIQIVKVFWVSNHIWSGILNVKGTTS